MPDPIIVIPGQTPPGQPPVEPIKNQDPPNPPNTDPVEQIEVDGVKYDLDKEGNALDKDGKVFKTKADLDALSTVTDVEQVEIDGVVYTIDKDGNAVDDNKAVKFTKDQLEKMQEVDTTGTLDVNNIIKTTAIPIYDSEGNEVVYDNTEEGLKNYVIDVRDSSYQEGQSAYANALLGKYPIINDIITHLELYGNLKDFNETPDYSKVTIDKNNTSQQESIILQARSLRGDTPEKARDYVQYLKDAKRLEEEATSELEYLNTYYSGIKSENAKKLNDRRTAEKKQYDEYWGVEVKNNQLHPINKSGSVYDIVTKGTIQIGEEKYTIPEKIRYTENGQVKIATRQEFFNYLYEPIQVNTPDGPIVMTRDQYRLALEQEQRTIGHDVFEAYKRFVGGDMTQIIKQAINENEVKKIKKLKSSTETTVKTGGEGGAKKLVFKY